MANMQDRQFTCSDCRMQKKLGHLDDQGKHWFCEDCTLLTCSIFRKNIFSILQYTSIQIRTLYELFCFQLLFKIILITGWLNHSGRNRVCAQCKNKTSVLATTLQLHQLQLKIKNKIQNQCKIKNIFQFCIFQFCLL